MSVSAVIQCFLSSLLGKRVLTFTSTSHGHDQEQNEQSEFHHHELCNIASEKENETVSVLC